MVKSLADNQVGNGSGSDTASAPKQSGVEAPEMPTSKSTKAPAFQFYPRDFLSSGKVDRMSMTERGAYITLLSRCWLDHGLPTEVNVLARMCRMPTKTFAKMWANSEIRSCFHEKGGRLHNDRLDTERLKQADYKRRQTDRAEKRWEKERQADAVALQGTHSKPRNALQSSSSSASSSASVRLEEEVDAALHAASPSVLVFPTSGKGAQEWHLRSDQVEQWMESFPAVRVLDECKKAHAWVIANPTKRKTARGMPAFLVRWLSTAQDRGGSSSQPDRTLSTPKTAGNVAALQSFVNRGKAAAS
jgi:uncharacterized protein YdaU (DUF1376 family)